MKSFSFVHIADLHLDSPFKELSSIDETISKELIDSSFCAFNNIIDLCLDKEVDFLLIAGDIYDGADRSLRAQLKFRDGLKRLDEAGIKTYIVHGNHDPLDGWSANLDWPNNTHIFDGKEVEEHIYKKDGEDIARILGISFSRRDIRANLSEKFPRKSTKDHLFNIGLLHCNIGKDTGHEPYAPCTLQDLMSHDFDYWALGHIHNNVVLNDSNPLVIYPGNIQGRHPREIGNRGCYLVNVDENGVANYNFIETDVVRWSTETISIASIITEQELLSKIERKIENIREMADGRPSISRIILSGRGEIYSSINRAGFLDDILNDLRENELGERQFVWIESFVNNTRSKIDRESLLKRDDFIGDMLKLFDSYLSDKASRRELIENLSPLFDSPGGRKHLENIEDKELIELLRNAESLALSELLEE